MSDGAAVALRPATPDDDPLLLELFVAARPELAMLPLPSPQREQLVEQQWRAQRAGHRAGHPDAVDRVVEHEGESVGRVLVDEGPPVTVVDLAVLPQRRGVGVGGAVLRMLLADADRRGVETRLTVRADNPARRLYERLGFVVAPDQAGIPGEPGVDLRLVRHSRSGTTP